MKSSDADLMVPGFRPTRRLHLGEENNDPNSMIQDIAGLFIVALIATLCAQ
ncbi:hypothetical protein ABT255_55485 [Streptomyces mirabilis]|uniref:hypothetical protein n=1 Tax=Streptomyces mirabilis TaxID=68239 RepID=UPI003332DD0D